MESVHKIGYCNLYHGDALEILKDLGTESIDVIMTDHPFFLSNGGSSKNQICT